MRRAAILLLALVYTFEASWLLQGGYDALLRAAVDAQPAEDACCVSRCGCPMQKQKKRECCCYPNSGTDAAPSSGEGSLLEEARCGGSREAVAHAVCQPVLLSVTQLPPVDLSDRRPKIPDLLPSAPLPDAPPDKVPV